MKKEMNFNMFIPIFIPPSRRYKSIELEFHEQSIITGVALMLIGFVYNCMFFYLWYNDWYCKWKGIPWTTKINWWMVGTFTFLFIIGLFIFIYGKKEEKKYWEEYDEEE
jgi:hypothetical protein